MRRETASLPLALLVQTEAAAIVHGTEAEIASPMRKSSVSCPWTAGQAKTGSTTALTRQAHKTGSGRDNDLSSCLLSSVTDIRKSTTGTTIPANGATKSIDSGFALDKLPIIKPNGMRIESPTRNHRPRRNCATPFTRQPRVPSSSRISLLVLRAFLRSAPTRISDPRQVSLLP